MNPDAFGNSHAQGNPFAHNIRRLMARNGLTLRALVNASGLHERTVKAALNGAGKPHARTLHRLAVGLGVSADELFQLPAAARVSSFNRQTNGAVEAIVARDPQRFAAWTEADRPLSYQRISSVVNMG